MKRPNLSSVPIGTTIAFVLLYALSALLYPGGTRAEPNRVGFSFYDNYWCDVLDRTTYGGRPNPAAPIALGATIVLALGFATLWWIAPTVYPAARRRGALVRGAGIASGALTPLIATSYHDTAINVASGLGALAFILTMSAVRAREGKPLVVLAIATLLSAGTNFTMWRTGWALGAMPLVQKLAFLAFLSWICAFSLRVRARSERRTSALVR